MVVPVVVVMPMVVVVVVAVATGRRGRSRRHDGIDDAHAPASPSDSACQGVLGGKRDGVSGTDGRRN